MVTNEVENDWHADRNTGLMHLADNGGICRISYQVKVAGPVSLKVYNMTGELVKVLVNNEYKNKGDAGVVVWDGINYNGNAAASGIYLIHIGFPDETITK